LRRDVSSKFRVGISHALSIAFLSNGRSIETALPPAAAHGLGWGPVATSGVLGASSVVVFLSMMLVMYLSGKVNDILMVAIGNMFWIVGGAGMYFLWTDGAQVWHYVVPVMIGCSGFPFIAASNRSNFTKAVASIPELEDYQAVMQAVLSMAASVAGFV
jgi:Na+/melibiose symporter-like transporter